MSVRWLWDRLSLSTRPSLLSTPELDPSKESQPSLSPLTPDRGLQSLMALEKLYAVRDSTLEIYFQVTLSRFHASDGAGQKGEQLSSISHGEDLFEVALEFIRTTSDSILPPSDVFIPVLARCPTQGLDFVRGADEYMAEKCGISSLSSPILRQLLVSLAIKHRNLNLLAELLEIGAAPDPNVFHTINPTDARAESLSLLFEDPHYARDVWSQLLASGWVEPARLAEITTTSKSTDFTIPSPDAGFDAVKEAVGFSAERPAAALATLTDIFSCGYDPAYRTGSTLDLLVASGTPSMLLRFLPLVSRTLYDSVSPHPRWPGRQSLVTVAAARAPQPFGLGMLRVLVEIGGMDINVTSWYKRSNDDSHSQTWDSRLPDGSCADETPLHAAVQSVVDGDVSVVRYLLGRRPRMIKDAWGRDPLERAIFLGKEDVVMVFKEFGWPR
ncbi:hypothetical protein GQ53DRAFT_740583 [Thozetella sp. PMI_491]|nr:hypothetical protein GQ53DRAFT_740583 [Thozetella sp. PMI_491]